MPAFEEVKQVLRHEAGGAGGAPSVYDHLVAVLHQLLREAAGAANGGDGSGSFESLSAEVREAFLPRDLGPNQRKDLQPVAARSSQLGWARSQAALLKAGTSTKSKGGSARPSSGGEGDEDGGVADAGVPVQAEVLPPADLSQLDLSQLDLTQQAKMWQWAGLSLGGEATYLLQLSLRQLASSRGLRSLRFWGKILAREGDYFIAECSTAAMANPAPSAADRRQWEGLEGANKYTYFVTTTPAGPDSWVQLPAVTPEQVLVAQRVRRFFSGRLHAAVPCFPPFPATPPPSPPSQGTSPSSGMEANLLRATIALITSDAKLAVAGHWHTTTITTDDGQDFEVAEPADEQPAVEADALLELDGWVHTEPAFNSAGRYQVPPEASDEEGEALAEAEPPQHLRPLSDDGSGSGDDGGGALSAWATRRAADGTVVVKSLRWPGAVAVAKPGCSASSLNIGFGVRAMPSAYQPPLPAPVQREFPMSSAEEEEGAEGQALEEAPDVIAEPAGDIEEDE